MALELSDEILISAPRDRVYAALNNPEILQQCIPGCEATKCRVRSGQGAPIQIFQKFCAPGAIRTPGLFLPFTWLLI